MTYLDLRIGTTFIEEIDGIEYEILSTPTLGDDGLVRFIAKRLDSEDRREFTFKADSELILA